MRRSLAIIIFKRSISAGKESVASVMTPCYVGFFQRGKSDWRLDHLDGQKRCILADWTEQALLILLPPAINDTEAPGWRVASTTWRLNASEKLGRRPVRRAVAIVSKIVSTKKWCPVSWPIWRAVSRGCWSDGYVL